MSEHTPLWSRIRSENKRKYYIIWLYLISIVHFIVGVLLTQITEQPFFNLYHLQIEQFFWPAGAPENARALQVWWMSLMGATLQYLSILMLLLVYLGHTLTRPVIWFGLLVAFLVWIPQDIYVSITTQTWLHLFINALAIITIVPPLLILCLIDRRKNKENATNKTNT